MRARGGFSPATRGESHGLWLLHRTIKRGRRFVGVSSYFFLSFPLILPSLREPGLQLLLSRIE
jgi:hypothetical protein